MANLNDLYTGTFVVLFIIVLSVFIYHYLKEEDELLLLDTQSRNKSVADFSDIYSHMKNHYGHGKAESSTTFVHMMKHCMLGIFRGFLMGLLIGGFEGAVVTAITLGMINSIMSPIEKHI
jgi:hypothetical protein